MQQESTPLVVRWQGDRFYRNFRRGPTLWLIIDEYPATSISSHVYLGRLILSNGALGASRERFRPRDFETGRATWYTPTPDDETRVQRAVARYVAYKLGVPA